MRGKDINIVCDLRTSTLVKVVYVYAFIHRKFPSTSRRATTRYFHQCFLMIVLNSALVAAYTPNVETRRQYIKKVFNEGVIALYWTVNATAVVPTELFKSESPCPQNIVLTSNLKEDE